VTGRVRTLTLTRTAVKTSLTKHGGAFDTSEVWRTAEKSHIYLSEGRGERTPSGLPKTPVQQRRTSFNGRRNNGGSVGYWPIKGTSEVFGLDHGGQTSRAQKKSALGFSGVLDL